MRSAALRLFAERGFRETTAAHIASAAGVSRRSFFLHFGSKDEVVLSHITEQLALLRIELEGSPQHLDRVDRAGHAVVKLAESMQGRDDLLLQLQLLHLAPELSAINLQQLTQFEAAITEAARRWRTKPPVADDLTHDDGFTDLLGTSMIAALRAGLNQWRGRGGQASLSLLVAANVERLRDGLATCESR